MINPFLRTLKVSDLLDIDASRIERSEKLKVEYIDTYHVLKKESIWDKIKKLFRGKSILMFYNIYKYKIHSDSGSVYTVFIKIAPSFDKSKFLSNKIEVFCQCADFKYRVAYWLNQRDNLYRNPEIDEHLGIALTERPTKITPSNLCKHIYACLLDFRTHINKLVLS